MVGTKMSVSSELKNCNCADQQQYPELLEALKGRFSLISGNLFKTDAKDLFPAFLAALPAEYRQHYTCNSCRHFVERFGNLAIIDEDGKMKSAVWNHEIVPEFFKAPIGAMEKLVNKAKITSVFYSAEPVYGTPVTGPWNHFSVVPYRLFVNSPTENADQAMALKINEFLMITHGLLEFPLEVAVKAHALLKSGNLYRSEKAEACADWFVNLHKSLENAKGKIRQNIIWLAAAKAPVGFAHIKSSMIGTLLDNVKADLPFDSIKRKWDEKMNPLQYQRPQAAPSEGNIKQAEKIISVLRAAGSLERRFARLEEIQAIWKPTKTEPERPEGVFGHLKAKHSAPEQIEQPEVVMTFEKFRNTVLPEAAQMECYTSARWGNMPFVGMATAVNPDAPPILQWDYPDQRNPVSWFVYSGGSFPPSWKLPVQTWVEVTAVTLLPPMWNPERDHGQHGKGAFFLLKNCVDQLESGNALFPEILKSEYHGIRATIEAYSRTAKLQGREEASACGLDFRAGPGKIMFKIRVTDKHGMKMTYSLDRWD